MKTCNHLGGLDHDDATLRTEAAPLRPEPVERRIAISSALIALRQLADSALKGENSLDERPEIFDG